MADYGLNTVPLGTAGTGAAFLLPDSQTTQNFTNQEFASQAAKAQAIAKANAEAQAQADKQAKALAAAYKENQLKVTNGILHHDELQKTDADHMQKGAYLMANGINPFAPDPNNPEAVKQGTEYQLERARVLGLHNLQSQLQQQAQAQENLIKANPDAYDPESINNFHSFLQKPLSEIADKGLTMPEVQKQFDMNAEINKLTPSQKEVTYTDNKANKTYHLVVPDSNAHATTAETALQNNPSIRNFVQKQIGVPIDNNPNGLSLNEAMGIKDPNQLRSTIDAYWRSKDNIGKLAQMGIKSYNDPNYSMFVDSQAQQLQAAKQKYNSVKHVIATTLDNKVHKVNDTRNDYGALNQYYKNREEAQGQEDRKDKKDDGLAKPTYNVGGSVIAPKATNAVGVPGTKSFVTSPMEIDAGDLKGAVVPDRMYNTETGKYAPNTDARNVKAAKIRLMPVLSTTGQLLNDEQVKQAKEGTLKINGKPVSYGDVDYNYMVFGREQGKKPAMKEGNVTAPDGTTVKGMVPDGNKQISYDNPVAFPAESLTNDKFNKKVDFSSYEKNLPKEIQYKIYYKRAKTKYPQLSDTEALQVAKETYDHLNKQ